MVLFPVAPARFSRHPVIRMILARRLGGSSAFHSRMKRPTCPRGAGVRVIGAIVSRS